MGNPICDWQGRNLVSTVARPYVAIRGAGGGGGVAAARREGATRPVGDILGFTGLPPRTPVLHADCKPQPGCYRLVALNMPHEQKGTGFLAKNAALVGVVVGFFLGLLLDRLTFVRTKTPSEKFLDAFNDKYPTWVKKGWVKPPASISQKSHSDLLSKTAK